ncbi:MAG: hypothetical protein ACYDHX_08075 [Methanothrix sp.]
MMRGYPKGSLSKIDYENLLAMPEHAEQAKTDLAKLAMMDDAKIRIYEADEAMLVGEKHVTGPGADGTPIDAGKYTEIANPLPAWKRAGFESKTALAATVAVAVDAEVKPTAEPPRTLGR